MMGKVNDMVRCAKERHRRRHVRDRQSGVALLITVASLTLLITLVSDFSYGTNIHMTQAANARDELCAHYLARSSLSLSRLLIKIQQRFVEPIMSQAQTLLNDFTKGAGAGMAISLRVTDYAGTLMGFFGGSKDEVAGLGSLIGIDTAGAKGLGIRSGHIDAEITAEDGKIDLNCGGGSAATRDKQILIFRLLSGLAFSPRYNRLFTERNADGQFIDRVDLVRGLIDWADGDEQLFSIEPGSTGAEDYRYDARADPYRAHNNTYDTIDEVGLVRSMDARFLEAFLPYLTVYASDPSCKVNLSSIKGDCTPLLVGLIRAAVMKDYPLKPLSDPTILDDNRVYPLASILCERGTAVGFENLDTIINVLTNPQNAIARDDPRYQLMQGMTGITISKNDLAAVAYVGPPRVYRIVATGESGKVKKKITAILDTKRSIDNPVTMNAQAEKASGVLQYLREE